MRPITFLALVEAHQEANASDGEEAAPKKKVEVVETTIDKISWW